MRRPDRSSRSPESRILEFARFSPRPSRPAGFFLRVSGHGPAFASRLGRGVAHARSRGRCMQNPLALAHDALACINGAFLPVQFRLSDWQRVRPRAP